MKGTPLTLLRQERERRGWSRAYIAEKIEVDVATVGRWERGERLPHPHHRQKLCTLFGKDVQELGLLSEVSEVEIASVNSLNTEVQALVTEKKDEASPSVSEQILGTIDEPVYAAQPLLEGTTELILGRVEHEPAMSKALLTMSQQNRQRMLRKMYVFWIDGVLKQSLRGTELISLNLEECSDAVVDPWMLALQPAEVVSQSLPSCMHIEQLYDEADGQLLILGGPGSGKTTLLLALTRILLERASRQEIHPIPVVFNLASWAIKRQSLDDWLVEELRSKYQVPRKLAQTWVQMEQILPLLDGLDEVRIGTRDACIETINAYRREHGLQPTVVCSRQSDYFAQDARLLLRRGMVVQPLNTQQIAAYLASVGGETSALYTALLADTTLLELATSPLLLNILVLTYQNDAVGTISTPLSLDVRRNEVFANYVERMLTHRKLQSHYTRGQMLFWLAWLARRLVQQQQTYFYIERMQPDWLLDQRALRWYCRLLIGSLIGLLGGLTGMIADVPLYEVVHKLLFEVFGHVSMTNLECADTLPSFTNIATSIAALFSLPIVTMLYGVSFGIGGGLLSGGWRRKETYAQSVETGSRHTRLYQRVLALLLGAGCGSIFMLINLFWVPCPLPSTFYDQIAEEWSYGLCGVLIGGLIGLLMGDLFGARKYIVQPTEALVWTRTFSRRHAISACLGAIFGAMVGVGTELVSEVYLKFFSWQSYLPASALMGSLLGVLIGGGMGGFSRQMLEKHHLIRPNEGIRRSMCNGLLVGLPVGLALTCFSLSLTFWLTPAHTSDGILWSFSLGTIVASLLILLNGGYACLQHIVLRLMLLFQGSIPWNYPRFLDEAAEKQLLRKVGGGYIFMHRLLLEYFASYVTETQERPASPQKRRFLRKKV